MQKGDISEEEQLALREYRRIRREQSDVFASSSSISSGDGTIDPSATGGDEEQVMLGLWSLEEEEG